MIDHVSHRRLAVRKIVDVEKVVNKKDGGGRRGMGSAELARGLDASDLCARGVGSRGHEVPVPDTRV